MSSINIINNNNMNISSFPSSSTCITNHDELSAMGIMDGAYFVSRKELLDWVNQTFQLNLNKVEQCANGAVYLQIMDSLFDKKVPMQKVRWNAKLEYEFVQNYKILQEVFNKLNIHKHIEVGKLIKAKYQDNLEFLQWMKAYWERQTEQGSGNRQYDPIERRKLSGINSMGMPEWVKFNANQKDVKNSKKSLNEFSSTKVCTYESNASNFGSENTSGNVNTNLNHFNNLSNIKNGSNANTSTYLRNVNKSNLNTQKVSNELKQFETLKLQLAQKEEEFNQMKELLVHQQIEREFYYNKLRDIEFLCHKEMDEKVVNKEQILAILYATEGECEEEGDSRGKQEQQQSDENEQIENDSKEELKDETEK